MTYRHINKYQNNVHKIVEEKLIKDTKKLLSLGVGDAHILKQILRAATNNEIISNRERIYVKSLIEKQTTTDEKTVVKSAKRQGSYVVKQESKSPNKTIIIGIIAGIAAAVVAVSFMAMPGPPDTIVPDPVILITLDAVSYAAGDFIDIRASTDLDPGSVVQLMIQDSEMNTVWSWETITDSDGSFSALVLAGYDNWQPGTHIIEAVHDDKSHVYEFEYTG